ncbi:hypothetical protein ACN1YD_003385 [Vibrio cholerae]|uniref:hypothetical protein n=1 Tax=Vibrio cholerae TaxID=666 RepID=UPI001115950A|nr:hypothetical protein [Vibrio cholerae]
MKALIEERINTVKSSETYLEINKLEKEGAEILELISKYGVNPDYNVLKKAKQFLINVEHWKFMGLDMYQPNVHRNCALDIWDALIIASESDSDLKQLESLMELSGLGKSVGKDGRRSAKVATAVLRMLYPEKWGVVDWRVGSILEVVDLRTKTINLSKVKNGYRRFKKIDAQQAVDMQLKYRMFSDLRASDVDMALFNVSLEIWPMNS